MSHKFNRFDHIRISGNDMILKRVYNNTQGYILSSSEYFDGSQTVFTYRIRTLVDGCEGYINENQLVAD